MKIEEIVVIINQLSELDTVFPDFDAFGKSKVLL